MKKLLTLTAILISLNCLGQISNYRWALPKSKSDTTVINIPANFNYHDYLFDFKAIITFSALYDEFKKECYNDSIIIGYRYIIREIDSLTPYSDTLDQRTLHNEYVNRRGESIVILYNKSYPGWLHKYIQMCYIREEEIKEPRIEPNGLDDNFMNWLKTKQ